MFIRRCVLIASLVTFLFSPLAHAVRGQSPEKGGADLKNKTKIFFEKYCLSCHDEDTKKGGVSLQDLNEVTADNASMWKRIWEQVALREMPPRKSKTQPPLID